MGQQVSGCLVEGGSHQVSGCWSKVKGDRVGGEGRSTRLVAVVVKVGGEVGSHQVSGC